MPKDPHYSNVTLLLRGEGSNGSATIVDSSSQDLDPDTNDDVTVSTGVFKYGGSSLRIPAGTDNRLNYDESDLGFGTNDWTIEGWIRVDNLSRTATIVGTSPWSPTNGFWWRVETSNKINFHQVGGGGAVAGTGVLVADVWYHVAAVRDGSTIRTYINGQQDGTKSAQTSFNAAAIDIFGIDSSSDYALGGYVDDFRITKDVCRYPGGTSFTPPAQLPAKDYPTTPPLSHISSGDVRTLGFHAFQMYDVLTGSGDPDAMPKFNLNIVSSTGSGPLYNVTFAYSGTVPANSGLNTVQIGDKLFIADDVDNSGTGGSKQWYRYDITAKVGTPTATSGTFTCKYINDTASGGDASPNTLHYQYDSYGGSLDVNVIGREVNTQFLLG